jgi:hypothetical protein
MLVFPHINVHFHVAAQGWGSSCAVQQPSRYIGCQHQKCTREMGNKVSPLGYEHIFELGKNYCCRGITFELWAIDNLQPFSNMVSLTLDPI